MNRRGVTPFLFAKAVVLVGWALVLGSFFVPGDSLGLGALRASAFVLLAAHALETVVFLPTLRRAEGSLAAHIGWTLVFGMVHYGEVRSRLDRAAANTPSSE